MRTEFFQSSVPSFGTEDSRLLLETDECFNQPGLFCSLRADYEMRVQMVHRSAGNLRVA